MEAPEHHHHALGVLHYVLPAILLAYYVIAQIVSICTLQKLKSRGRRIKRRPIVLLQCTVLILYIIEASLLVLDSLLSHPSNSSTDNNVRPLFISCPYRRTFMTLTTYTSGRSMSSLKYSYGPFSLPLSSSQGTTLYGIHSMDLGSYLSSRKPSSSASKYPR